MSHDENRISDLIDGGIQKENELFKGTKGNWYLQDYTDAYTNIIRSNDGINETIYITNIHGTYKNNRYDALLMSKSKDMLEKLQESTEVIKWYMENSTSEQPEPFFNIGANQIEQNEQLIKQATEL